MSLTCDAIKMACDQERATGLDVGLCALFEPQEDRMASSFKLCKRDENMQRSLTLRIHQTMEVHYPGSAFLLECIARIRRAIEEFWSEGNEQIHSTVEIC